VVARHALNAAILTAMTARQIEAMRSLDGDEVAGWRFEELLRAGYTEKQSLVLADRKDIELHLAVKLVHTGCPRELALRILL
jgi:hypothetical protein